METARHIFRIDTKRAKTVFITVSVLIFIALFACPIIAGLIDYKTIGPTQALTEYRKFHTYIIPAVFSLCVLAFLWIYGKYRMFGFQWQLHNDGLRVLKDNHEIRFVRWENITKIRTGYLVIFTRDGLKLPVTLPPPLQRQMQEKIHDIMNEKGLSCRWVHPLLSRLRNLNK